MIRTKQKNCVFSISCYMILDVVKLKTRLTTDGFI